MLKNLNYSSIFPKPIFLSLAKSVNNIDISTDDDSYFEHYETGIYRHDGYPFNFYHFINDRTNSYIKGIYNIRGVCDDYHQILDKYSDIINDPNKSYVIGLTTVKRECQPSLGGWRWSGWGEYIGDQNPQHEYLYDDTHIDIVYCFSIFEIDERK